MALLLNRKSYELVTQFIDLGYEVPDHMMALLLNPKS